MNSGGLLKKSKLSLCLKQICCLLGYCIHREHKKKDPVEKKSCERKRNKKRKKKVMKVRWEMELWENQTRFSLLLGNREKPLSNVACVDGIAIRFQPAKVMKNSFIHP